MLLLSRIIYYFFFSWIFDQSMTRVLAYYTYKNNFSYRTSCICYSNSDTVWCHDPRKCKYSNQQNNQAYWPSRTYWSHSVNQASVYFVKNSLLKYNTIKLNYKLKIIICIIHLYFKHCQQTNGKIHLFLWLIVKDQC